MIAFGRLRQLVRKEFRQLLRDPRARRMLFISPIVQLLIFGYAVNTDVRHTKTMILDLDQTEVSRALVSSLTATGYFDVTARGKEPSDIARALDHGDVVMGALIPRGFAADLARGRQAEVQLLVDGTTANTANVALGYANQIIARYALERGAAARALSGMGTPGVDFRARAWYNPNLESRAYNVPAVMGNIVLMMSLLLTSLAVVREREIGTLEQLMVSPLTPVEMIVGKTLPSAFVALVDMVLVTAISMLWFHIPMRGSFLLLGVSSLFFIFTGLGVGLFISTVSNTQQEAFMSMFLFFLPAMMLSGMMFPVENMPHALQYVTLADPLRHYILIVRGVFLRGAGWQALAPQIITLGAIGVGVLAFATTRFHKTTA
ncbi:MAG: ABC transporter permease [Gemmatimonadales bacterium]